MHERRRLQRRIRRLVAEPPSGDLKFVAAGCLISAGRAGEAVGLQRRLLDQRERMLGPDDPALWTDRMNYAFSLCRQQRLDEGIAEPRRVLENSSRVAASSPPSRPPPCAAWSSPQRRRPLRAGPGPRRRPGRTPRALNPPGDPALGALGMVRGESLFALERYDEALEALEPALPILRRDWGPDGEYTQIVVGRLVTICDELGLEEQAEEYCGLATR